MSQQIHMQDLDLPSVIGKYQVVGELGRGGFGMVLKARHEGLNKLVAIKLLHASLVLDPNVRARFEQEATAGAGLSHPNLVSVIDSGFTDRGEPYLVMEYVEGTTLEDFVETAKPNLTELLGLLIQVGKALRCLHESRIVHRDLKTSNILVQQIGEERYARLLDLGIAKVFGAGGDAAGGSASGAKKPQHTLTSTGMIFGSPSFMSPEQCQGQQIDARSDIYSFGCVIYQCMTGEYPFDADNPLAVMLKHLQEEAPALECKTAQEAELAAIVKKCLAKDREQRYPSMKELLDALQRVAGMSSAERGHARPGSVSRSYMAVEAPAASGVAGGAPSPSGGTSISMVLVSALAALAIVAVGFIGMHLLQGHSDGRSAQVVAPAVAPVVETPKPVVAAPPPVVAPQPVAQPQIDLATANALKAAEEAKLAAEQAKSDRIAAEEEHKKAEEERMKIQAQQAAMPQPDLAAQVAAAQARNRALAPLMNERYNMVREQLDKLNPRMSGQQRNPYDAVSNFAQDNAVMRAHFNGQSNSFAPVGTRTYQQNGR